ncbi:MAG: alpha-amylase family glycosyl hydrolase [Chloroflexota bacterium]
MRPARLATPVQSPRFGDDWWQRGVVYQIYPRSYADTDGNGIGDLAGIVEHLDYLGPDGLGIDAIWLSPIYPSPGLDLGYDVADHERVDPLFGSEADFDRLVDEAHRRGIRVVLDLVMNHTSDQHHWFQESSLARTGRYADRYLWRDPAATGPDGVRLPPNNWLSYFGGPGWEWSETRQQFYYHTFLVEQAELNWRAPGVEEDQFRMVRGWLQRGVDGFRLDVFNIFLKHPDLLSNPIQPGPTAWERQLHLYDRNQPDFPALIGRFRAILDESPGRMSVGELFDGTVETAAGLTTDRHLVFDWELLRAPWTGDAVNTAIALREAVYGPDRWPTAVLSNHDQPRHVSRLVESAGATNRDAVARAAAVLLLTLRGTPFLYYGEELGMGDVDVPPDESVDPPAKRVTSDFTWWDRSRCRTPMPWSPGPGAGFTTGRPWLRLGPDAETRNVEVEARDPGSVLAFYRRLIALRAATTALQLGSFRPVGSPVGDLVTYIREMPGQVILVALNLGREAVTWELPEGASDVGWQPLLATDASRPLAEPYPVGSAIVLAPDEALILEAR